MSDTVSPAPIWDVINGFGAYWAVHAAVEMGVFDALAARPATSDELAAAVGVADAADLALLAELLTALGLLDTDGTRFTLTAPAERFLLSGAPSSMTDLVRFSPGPHTAWPQLADTLRAGLPSASVRAALDRRYPDLVRATAATQRAVARAVARELAGRDLLPRHAVVVDLGCGSGVWTAELLDAADQAYGVVVDLPDVLGVARSALAGRHVEYVTGDYVETPLPVAHADVVVLTHVLRAEPAARAHALLDRAMDLLDGSGVLVIADYFRPGPAPDTAACVAARHELLLSLTMRASTAGRGISLAQLTGWLAAAGAETLAVLEPVPRQCVHLVTPRPPGGSR